MSARDGSYHQGTVWPWLLGAFVEAWVRVRGDGLGERGAKRDCDQASEQTHQQRPGQLAPPLFVCTQEVAHLALHQARGNDGAASVFLPDLFRHSRTLIRTGGQICHGTRDRNVKPWLADGIAVVRP